MGWGRCGSCGWKEILGQRLPQSPRGWQATRDYSFWSHFYPAIERPGTARLVLSHPGNGVKRASFDHNILNGALSY